MNRQKKQKKRIASSTGKSRPMPANQVQMQIGGRPTPEQIQLIDSLGPLGYRSLAAYRMLLRQLMSAALPILEAKMDWRVAADVPSTVWYISQAKTPKYLFTGLRNADGHDIDQVRATVAPSFPGSIVVRPHAGGQVEFHLQHVGLGAGVEEVYSFRYGPEGGWLGVLSRPGVREDILLHADGMGILLDAHAPVDGPRPGDFVEVAAPAHVTHADVPGASP